MASLLVILALRQVLVIVRGLEGAGGIAAALFSVEPWDSSEG